MVKDRCNRIACHLFLETDLFQDGVPSLSFVKFCLRPAFAFGCDAAAFVYRYALKRRLACRAEALFGIDNGPSSPPAATRQPSFIAALLSEGWSGREDLNAPEAHKPPWRIALPAFGGLRLEFQIVEPYAPLARFQEFFSFSCWFMVNKFFSMQNIEFSENLTPFWLFKSVLIQPSSQVIRYTNVSFAIFPFEYI